MVQRRLPLVGLLVGFLLIYLSELSFVCIPKTKRFGWVLGGSRYALGWAGIFRVSFWERTW